MSHFAVLALTRGLQKGSDCTQERPGSEWLERITGKRRLFPPRRSPLLACVQSGASSAAESHLAHGRGRLQKNQALSDAFGGSWVALVPFHQNHVRVLTLRPVLCKRAAVRSDCVP